MKMKNDAVLEAKLCKESLGRRFNSFINSSDDRSFCLGVADYTKIIIESSFLMTITKDIDKAKRDEMQGILTLIRKCEGEFSSFVSSLFAEIKRANIEEKLVINTKDSYEKFKIGRSRVTFPHLQYHYELE